MADIDKYINMFDSKHINSEKLYSILEYILDVPDGIEFGNGVIRNVGDHTLSVIITAPDINVYKEDQAWLSKCASLFDEIDIISIEDGVCINLKANLGVKST